MKWQEDLIKDIRTNSSYDDADGNAGNLIRNLNKDVWNVDLRCLNDWGIGFVWKI